MPMPGEVSFVNVAVHNILDRVKSEMLPNL